MTLDQRRYVFLSYSHENKTIVEKVRQFLEAENSSNCLDDQNENTNGDMRCRMDAMKNAVVVCCFISPEYECSQDCRKELEYAHQLGKAIIPCIIVGKDQWTPGQSKWLTAIIDNKTFINLHAVSDFNMKELLKLIINEIQTEKSVDITILKPRSMESFEPIRSKYLQENNIRSAVNKDRILLMEACFFNLVRVDNGKHIEQESKLQKRTTIHKCNCSRAQHYGQTLYTFEKINGIKIPIDIKDIFNKCKTPMKKILLLGQTGVGKKTFCDYAAYKWAKGEIWEEYKLVVLIQLRSLTDARYPADKVYEPVDLLEKEYFASNRLPEETKKSFENDCKKNQVLWILAGYGEFYKNVPQQLQKTLNYILENQSHIVTSRPCQLKHTYDMTIEITGLTDKNIEDYAKEFFHQVPSDIAKDDYSIQIFLKTLKSNNIVWNVAHIPVLLELICNAWNDSPDWNPSKITIIELYTKLIAWCFRQYLKKKGINSHQLSLEQVFDKCRYEANLLESLALSALLPDSTHLTPHLCSHSGEKTQFPWNSDSQLLNIGLIKLSEDVENYEQYPINKAFCFVHRSIQDYFTARCLLKTLNSPNKRQAIDFIQYYKYDRRFQFIFVCASGLVSKNVFKSSIDPFWSIINEQSRGLIEMCHIKLLIECIGDLKPPNNNYYFQNIQLIVEYLRKCVSKNSWTFVEQLGESFERTTTLGSQHLIQSKIIELLKSQEPDVQRKTLYIISKLTIQTPELVMVSLILKSLRSCDGQTRQKGCDALAKIGQQTLTDSILQGLWTVTTDDNSDVRSAAIDTLNTIYNRTSNDTLIPIMKRCLTDTDPIIRTNAYNALRHMGTNAINENLMPLIVDALGDESLSIQVTASCLLRNMAENYDISKLISYLRKGINHQNPDVRRSVHCTLEILRSKTATNEVIGYPENVVTDEASLLDIGENVIVEMMGVNVEASKVNISPNGGLGSSERSVKNNTCDAIRAIYNSLENKEDTDFIQKTTKSTCSTQKKGTCDSVKNKCKNLPINKMTANAHGNLKNQDSLIQAHYDKDSSTIDSKLPVTPNMISHFVNALKNTDSLVRMIACETLGIIDHSISDTGRSIDCLLDALRDSDSSVRNSACIALAKIMGTMPSNEIKLRLIEAFQDTHAFVRWSACYILGKLQETIVSRELTQCLLNALSDNDSSVRRQACFSLGHIDQTLVTDSILEHLVRLLSDNDYTLATNARNSLINLNSTQAINDISNFLISAMKNESESIRNDACQTARKMGAKAVTVSIIDTLFSLLNDPEISVRENARCTLQSMIEKGAKTPVIAHLIYDLRHGNLARRVIICDFIETMGIKIATKELIDCLTHILFEEDMTMSNHVCRVLANMGEQAATNQVATALVIALKHKSSSVRSSACYCIRSIGKLLSTNTIIAGLIRALTDEDWSVRKSACEALTNMNDIPLTNEIVDFVLNALKHRSGSVRQIACDFIGSVGEKGVTKELIDAIVYSLEDNDWRVQRSAWYAVGKMNEKAIGSQVISKLSNALNSKVSFVRWSACSVLELIGEQAVTNELIVCLMTAIQHSDCFVRLCACTALQRMSTKPFRNEIMEGLIVLLKDKEPVVKRKACFVCRDMGEKVATNEVIEILMDAMQDEESEVREAACVSLGSMIKSIARKDVIDLLIHALKDNDAVVRKNACYALGNVGEETTTTTLLDSLINALGDDNAVVRRSAANALGSKKVKSISREMLHRILDVLANSTIDLDDYSRANLLEWILYLSCEAQSIDDNLLSKLFSSIKVNSAVRFGQVSSEQLMNKFLETQDPQWLHLVMYVVLIQGASVTFESDVITLYDAMDRVQFTNLPSQVIQSLSDALKDSESCTKSLATNLCNMEEAGSKYFWTWLGLSVGVGLFMFWKSKGHSR